MFDFLVGNDFLSAIVAFVIVLIPAVIIHELGHFFAAKAVGITILEFGIGFPPRIGKLFTWRETEFTFNLIPLGGFVRPLGEDIVRPTTKGLEAKDQLHHDQIQPNTPYYAELQRLKARGFTEVKSVYDVKPLPRIFFMAAGALANFVFAVVVFILVGLVGLPTEVGTRIGLAELSPNSAMATIGFQKGDWIRRVNDTPIASYDDFIETLQANNGQSVTVAISRPQNPNDQNTSFFDETLTFTVTPELLAEWAAIGSYVRVSSVTEGSPADQAGIQPGDLIYQFNDVSVLESFDPASDLQTMTANAAGELVTLAILRDGETTTVSLTPRVDPPAGEGRMGIGIRSEYTTPDESFVFIQNPEVDYIPQPFGQSIQYGFESTGEILGLILEFPSRLIRGETQPGENRIVSVVAVSQWGGELLQDSVEDQQISTFLRYIGLISIALGFTNLLPIPALDGGRILFAVIELIRGKPISPEREGFVHMIGLILLLSLSVLLIINDLSNPVTDLLP
ncbi:MAG: RIP metalloprotease RseP [Chloroflexi bacterium]|nr:MAG: RIP metalloprotease RseP [Chloroflexota bacterium]